MRCGTTGLRPTFGRVARTGAMTLCWSLDKIGPVTRTVEDAALVVSAAERATPVMLVAMSFEPVAASATLRPISLVVAVCSSTALAMVLWMSFTWLMMSRILPVAASTPAKSSKSRPDARPAISSSTPASRRTRSRASPVMQ